MSSHSSSLSNYNIQTLICLHGEERKNQNCLTKGNEISKLPCTGQDVQSALGFCYLHLALSITFCAKLVLPCSVRIFQFVDQFTRAAAL